MKKKPDIEIDKMQLKYYEASSLQEIADTRLAIKELETAIFPLAQSLAKQQRQWWDRVLSDRKLNREDGSYSIENNMIKFEPKLLGGKP